MMIENEGREEGSQTDMDITKHNCEGRKDGEM